MDSMVQVLAVVISFYNEFFEELAHETAPGCGRGVLMTLYGFLRKVPNKKLLHHLRPTMKFLMEHSNPDKRR